MAIKLCGHSMGCDRVIFVSEECLAEEHHGFRREPCFAIGEAHQRWGYFVEARRRVYLGHGSVPSGQLHHCQDKFFHYGEVRTLSVESPAPLMLSYGPLFFCNLHGPLCYQNPAQQVHFSVKGVNCS